MLRVSLLGNLGADPEVRTTQKGASMATFRVAVNQARMVDGERQETTEWFGIRALGRLADQAQKLTKGTRVLVDGRLEVTHFQGRDGTPRVGFDVWADEVINVAARPIGPDGEPTEPQAGSVAPAEGPVLVAAGSLRPRRAVQAVDELEDLPF